jgi:hypothetical protein
MMFLELFMQSVGNWLRDVVAELLGRCIGATVSGLRKRKRAQSKNGDDVEIQNDASSKEITD